MFKYDDININYEYIDNKKKKTLVYLHGWGQNIEMMEPIAKPFKKNYNVLILDLPGFGKSEEPKTIWTLDYYVLMVHELIKKLDITNPVLIGHSFGGKISIIYASKYKVDRLILLSSPYKVAIKKVSFKVKMLKKMAKIPGLGGIANFFKKHMGSTDYKNASDTMRAILVKHVNTDATENLKKIDVPVIVIWGTNDTTVDISNAYEIEKLVKDCAVIPYEGRTHFAYLENLQQTINIIDSFIK
jgi:pimeloyl-ACP methyl ester carboxylesterase